MSTPSHLDAATAPPRRSLSGRIGLALLAALALLAVFGPWLTPASPVAQDLSRTLAAPGHGFLLGSDHLGRSILARLVHALRLSLGLAAVSVMTAAIPGCLAGLLAAWRGGWVDRLLCALADAVLALPGLLMVLLMLAFAPGRLWPFYVGLGLTLWVEYFRLVRATAAVLLASPQVEASKLLGFGAAYIVRRHLLPELAPMVGTLMSFGAAAAVLALATAGFIGVGLRPPTAELGLMMAEWYPYYLDAPWLVAAPVMLLMTVVAALTLVARWMSRP